jgi:hypothetical protein
LRRQITGQPERELVGDPAEGLVAAMVIIRPNRWVETVRTASHMARPGRLRPPPSVIGMWCGKPRSRVVNGITWPGGSVAR